MSWQALFGERATTKIAAIYDTREAAASMADSLEAIAGIKANQWMLIAPHEKGFARKLEPETQGIARTGIRAHLILGAVGLLAGVMLWLVLYFLPITYIVASPVVSAAVIISFATILGMMLGGLVTARPDHQVVILKVRKAAEQGKWSLVLHPRDPRQCELLMKALLESEADVVRTV
ncbi:MAG TPA: hypothetical protein VKZ66_11615 [Pusillimonas sp.]|uniref:hypothetical protein n=1 Tax=unclassified Pusillimonas TaxID=2640016 RepID=UPI00261AEDF1|nr:MULTISPECIES: hypothetical protein [unclassified Pusillimonas]HLU20594.1 hypothetical protein [Pusillimonas sp.]